jgi:ferredoxin
MVRRVAICHGSPFVHDFLKYTVCQEFGIVRQFDERDTMFSRMGLIKGTRKYNAYYKRHPQFRIEDDRIRESTKKMMARVFGVVPDRLSNTQRLMAVMQKSMDLVSSLKLRKIRMDASDMPILYGIETDGEITRSHITVSKPPLIVAKAMNDAAHRQKVSRHQVKTSPEELTAIIKELALTYGADAVGIARLESHHHYSHRGDMYGMGVGYGDRICLSYRYAIVVASALNKEMINRAAAVGVWNAAMLGYARVTAVTAQLALYIKSLGYETQTDNFFEYHSPMTPLAAAAGIGQIGRCNCVISKEFGNRMKIGAVITSLPLIEDAPVDFGMVEFCQACLKCAVDCPAKAVSFQGPEVFNGLLQWKHHDTKCMEMWMNLGTGCGICMSSCPFSQGVDPGLIAEMKGNREIIQKILSQDDEKRDPDSGAFHRR